jgi:hypothetical protein
MAYWKGKIEWSSTGNPGDITIELLRNGSLQTVIQKATANDGIHKWNIPNDHPKGGGYSVRITSDSNVSVTDDSDGTFKSEIGASVFTARRLRRVDNSRPALLSPRDQNARGP